MPTPNLHSQTVIGGRRTTGTFRIITLGAVGTVGNLTISGQTATTITVALTEVTDGEGSPASYNARFGTASPFIWADASASEFIVSGVSIGATLEFTITGLTSGTNYSVQVEPFRVSDSVAAALSNIAPGTTNEVVPIAPTNVVAVVTATNDVDLTWIDNSTNETSYRIDSNEAGAGYVSLVGSLPINTTGFNDLTNRAEQAGVAYQVFAVNSAGDSPVGQSNVVTPNTGVVVGLGIPSPENFLYDPVVDGGYIGTPLPVLNNAYNLLNVPAMRCNLDTGNPADSYLEPRTGETIYKLTDVTTDGGANGVGPHFGYSNGGQVCMSYPWELTPGDFHITIYTFNDQFDGGGFPDSNFHYLRDLRLSNMSVSNRRAVPIFAGTGGTSFTFSKDPATPRIAWVFSGNAIVRLDTSDLSFATVHTTASNDGWLTNSELDNVFGYKLSGGGMGVWVRNAVFGRAADTLLTPSGTVNEHRVLQTGRYVFLDRTNGTFLAIYDVQTGITSADTVAVSGQGYGAHGAVMPEFSVSFDAFSFQGYNYFSPNPNGALAPIRAEIPGILGMAGLGSHMDGGWVQTATPLFADLWFCTYGVDAVVTGYAQDPVGAVAMDGRKYLIAQNYSTPVNNNYWKHPFPGWSASGHIIAWGSAMNGSTRGDLFCVKVPTT